MGKMKVADGIPGSTCFCPGDAHSSTVRAGVRENDAALSFIIKALISPRGLCPDDLI